MLLEFYTGAYDWRKDKNHDVASLSGYPSSESRTLPLTLPIPFIPLLLPEKASESDQDPGHLNNSVHLGWLHRVCDDPCCHF